MNLPQRTRTTRTAEAIRGAHAARTRTTFIRVVARQLNEIAPGTVRVRTVPVTREDRRRTWVILDDANGHPVKADADAHRAAYGLLQRAFPSADWTKPRKYDARTGVLAVDTPTAPAVLALDTAEEARQ